MGGKERRRKWGRRNTIREEGKRESGVQRKIGNKGESKGERKR